MNIPNEKLREAYWYLMKHPTGYQKSLDDIHPDLVEYLLRNGFIGEGINSAAEFRYHLTDFGEENVEMYYKTLTANLVREELDKADVRCYKQ